MSRRIRIWGKVENGLRYMVIIALLALIATTGWQLMQTPSSAAATPTLSGSEQPVSRPGASAPDAATLAKKIALRHLFGSVKQSATAAPPVTKERSNSAVQLRGIIFAADQDLARAILALDGNQQSYRVGSLLNNGAKLTAIQANRVILARDGKHYALVLADAPSRFNGDVHNLSISRGPPPARAALSSAPATNATTLSRLKALRAQMLSNIRVSRRSDR